MDSIVKYIFEAGMLKRVRRSGWWAEKVNDPESVADHSFRSAVVAFILAKMEGLDDSEANRLCTAAAFHDLHETRLLDLNKITARYITVTKELEQKVEKEQVHGMPKPVHDSILKTLDLTADESELLRDADYLECAFQAKEYASFGHKGAESWIESIKGRLKTKSAKKLLEIMQSSDPNSWWKGLKKLD